MNNLVEQEIENHREFLLGDIIVSTLNTVIPELFQICEQPNEGLEGHVFCKPLNYEYKCWLAVKDIRHATPVELKLKRRQSQPMTESDDIEYIENHISPLCQVIRFDDWDRAVHFHRALNAQKEIP